MGTMGTTIPAVSCAAVATLAALRFRTARGVQGREGTWGGRSTKIQKKHETTSGPGRFDNQKLILLESLDLATPHCPKASKQSNCTCFDFHTSPPMDRTETWHCKIHCALSFRTNSPARVCIARIGTSADMTTVMTLLLWHSRYLTNIDHPDFKRFPGFCFTMHTLLGQGSLESFKHPTNYT